MIRTSQVHFEGHSHKKTISVLEIAYARKFRTCTVARLRMRSIASYTTLGPSAEDGGGHRSTGGSPPHHVQHLFVYFRHGNFRWGLLVSPTATQGKESFASWRQTCQLSVLWAGPACGIGRTDPEWHDNDPTLLAGSKLAGRTDINEATAACEVTRQTWPEGDDSSNNTTKDSSLITQGCTWFFGTT